MQMTDSRFYKDLWAPTITLAVGLKVGVVLQPVADSAKTANSKPEARKIVFWT